jgi:hypothetical protein
VDISTMIPKSDAFMLKLNHYAFYWWNICWTGLTPLILAGITVFSWMESGRMKSGDYLFPAWTEVLGNTISYSSLSGIAAWIFYSVYDVHKNGKVHLKHCSCEFFY